MSSLPLGWQTDLAVLRLSGAALEEHPDHLVVRSPDNPTYHWGNVVVVSDPAEVDDPGRWKATFHEAFPAADHVSIGLVTPPRDPDAWREHGLELEEDVVLAAAVPLPPTEVAVGYSVRALTGEDWDRSLELRLHTWGHGGAVFERASTETRRRMVEAGHTRWFGAFAGDELAAELGVVDLGDGTARFQSVLTSESHRRRGLTRHLLAVAAGWAADRGAGSRVIVAEPGGDAERLYLAAAFEQVGTSVRASVPD